MLGDRFLFRPPSRLHPIKVTVVLVVGSYIKVQPDDGRMGEWITSADQLSPIPPPGDGLTDAQRKLLQAVKDGHNTYATAAAAVSALPGQKPWKEATVASVAMSLVRAGKLVESDDKPTVMKCV